jgi:hypothetical protein
VSVSAGRAVLVLAGLLVACVRPLELELPDGYDPAVEFHLRNQPGGFGDMARWVHQYMRAPDAKQRMAQHGYKCNLPFDKKLNAEPRAGRHHDMSCERAGWRGLFDNAPVIFGIEYPRGLIVSAEGYREGKIALRAPGVSFDSAEAFASFVLDTIQGSPCLDFSAYCQAQLERRRKNGWPAWDGKPLDIGDVQHAMHALRMHFTCDEWMWGNSEPLPLVLSGELAWGSCSSTDLLGKRYSVDFGVRLEDGALASVIAAAGANRARLPVVPTKPAADGKAEYTIVADKIGDLYGVRLNYVGPRFHDQSAQLPPLDAPSRLRLLAATLRLVQSAPSDDVARQPLLLQIRHGARVLAQVGAENVALAGELAAPTSVPAQASLIMARCGEGGDDRTLECYASAFRVSPEVSALMRKAGDEATRAFPQKSTEEVPSLDFLNRVLEPLK